VNNTYLETYTNLNLVQILNLYSYKGRVVQIQMYLHLYTRVYLYVFINIFNTITNYDYLFIYVYTNVYLFTRWLGTNFFRGDQRLDQRLDLFSHQS
jgi:hypothetical protein